jgi:hypothetical protein
MLDYLDGNYGGNGLDLVARRIKGKRIKQFESHTSNQGKDPNRIPAFE